MPGAVTIIVVYPQLLRCMPLVKRPIVHEFAAKAREVCGDAIEEIILCGSVARGDDRPDSDIDILVITPEED
ncbi:nucleotidyltransferase domain-containing protein [Methanoculleus sp. FWC-SCC3]|uniref:Nucleotidyltransferase domain-containing protein n=2 Tax=Methanoculleus methanifontis TaxID=2584086 RepID=A0ABT8M3U3_9EURY|nr:nucleotidyltransferase domain-containing protein [Methanoculleus sp. FWC-SCC3]